MKNIIKLILSLMLALSMSLCLFACDETDTPSADSKNNTEDTTGETEDTNPSADDLLDGSWEAAARKAINAEGVTIKLAMDMNIYEDSSCVTKSKVISTYRMSAGNLFASELMDMTYMFPEYGNEHVSGLQEATAIKKDGGYDLYVYGNVEGEKLYMLVNVTDAQADEAKEEFFASLLEVTPADEELSILDFNNVSTTVLDGGSIELSCTNVKSSAVDKYSELVGEDSIKTDALKYTVVVKDGKILSEVIELEAELEIDGVKQTTKCVATCEYEYTNEAVTVPADWDYDNDMEMSWTEYLQGPQG